MNLTTGLLYQTKLIELRRKAQKQTIIDAEFNIAFSIITRSSKQKLVKDMEDLNITINQVT